MANIMEINKELTEKLYDFLMVKKENAGHKNKYLDEIISKTKASMSKEQIAWVEQQVNS